MSTIKTARTPKRILSLALAVLLVTGMFGVMTIGARAANTDVTDLAGLQNALATAVYGDTFTINGSVTITSGVVLAIFNGVNIVIPSGSTLTFASGSKLSNGSEISDTNVRLGGKIIVKDGER